MDTYVAYVTDQESVRLAGSVRAIEPPADTRQSKRGNLYVVLDLSENKNVDQDGKSKQDSQQVSDLQQFAEHLISTIQRTYYTVKGAQSQVLAQGVQAAYQRIQTFNDENPNSRLKPSLIAACLLKNRLIIVTDRASVALIGEENVHVFPEDIVNLSLAQGDENIARLEIHRQELTTDGAFFLGSVHWLEQVTLRELAETVAYASADNCQTIADALISHGKHQPLGLLIAFEPPSSKSRQIAQSSSNGAGLESLATPSSLNDLPTSVTGGAGGRLQVAGGTGDRLQVAGDNNVQHADMPHADMPHANMPPTDTQLLIQNIRERWSRLRGRASGWGVPSLVSGADGEAILPPFSPPEPASGSRARLYTLTAVLLLTLVPLLVYILTQQQGSPSIAEADNLMAWAENRLVSAQGVYADGSGDQVQARTLLTEAENFLNRSVAITGRNDESVKLAADIQREFQDVLQVVPLYQLAEPLVTFPSNALPDRLFVDDQSIYVLDIGRNMVLHYRTDTSGEYIADSEGEVVLRQGSDVDNISVGRLADVGWQPLVPGVEDKANLLILDRNNNVFRYNEIEGTSRIDFGTVNALQISNRLAVYGGNIYIGDEGRSQIYRYRPGLYNLPEGWFAPQSGINLVGLLSIKIDGDIWLLFNNGQLLRYNQGQQKPFTLDDSIGLPEEPVDMYIGGQETSLIYIADAANERIMVFDKNGSYLRQLKAAEGNPLRGLRGIYADEVAGNLYILTQSALYQHPLMR